MYISLYKHIRILFKNMKVKTLRQIFKGCADDTRLRIINLLDGKALTVKTICSVLKLNQPTISKHLTRLRLLKLVIDKREGNLVYYRLNKNAHSIQDQVTSFITSQFHDLETFKKDKEAIQRKHNK